MSPYSHELAPEVSTQKPGSGIEAGQYLKHPKAPQSIRGELAFTREAASTEQKESKPNHRRSKNAQRSPGNRYRKTHLRCRSDHTRQEPKAQDKNLKHKKFNNNPEGFKALDAWIKQSMATNIHICMEATGHYGYALARHLHAKGHNISIVNPAGPNALARAQLSRTKTDKADAMRIAQFCRDHTPHLWTPPTEALDTLQALVRRREALRQMHQMSLSEILCNAS